MFYPDVWLSALAALVAFGSAGWLVSLARRDVSIVDSMWSIMFLVAAVIYAWYGDVGPRATLVMLLVAIWSVRLAGYITWRNWGEPEDHRYAAMREKHGEAFPLKSLPNIFWLQAALAWIIAMALYPALTGPWPLGASGLPR